MKDSFGREIKYMRLSVTDRCNLRCRYCMPADGVALKRHEDMLTEDEMIRAVAIASELGVNKLRITGGEPLVKKNIISICRRIAELTGIRDRAMTTNGTRLPEFASELKRAGIQRLNISLDSLDADKYRYITRCGELSEALRGIEAALAAGFEKIKINTVLIGGFNDDEIRSLAELSLKYPVEVRFIELMPMLAGGFGKAAYIPVSAVREALPEAEDAEERSGTAELLRLPGALGDIGLISPVSKLFCSSCDRIRLTADGRLKPCLHSPEEYPVKGLSEEELRQQLKRAISSKPLCHAELSSEQPSRAERSMDSIGG